MVLLCFSYLVVAQTGQGSGLWDCCYNRLRLLQASWIFGKICCEAMSQQVTHTHRDGIDSTRRLYRPQRKLMMACPLCFIDFKQVPHVKRERVYGPSNLRLNLILGPWNHWHMMMIWNSRKMRALDRVSYVCSVQRDNYRHIYVPRKYSTICLHCTLVSPPRTLKYIPPESNLLHL